MKKLKQFMLGAFTLGLLIFTSCNNLYNEATISGDNIKKVNKLEITATGSVKDITFPERGAERTILPGALDGNNLDFYLYGVNDLTGTTVNPSKVEFYSTAGSNGRVGSVEIDLATSKYTLYLAALKKGATPPDLANYNTFESGIKTSAVLFASATVDMRYGERASFYLSPYTLSGSGSVKLTIGTNWDIPSEYAGTGNITFGLYNINTDAEIQGKVTSGATEASTKTNGVYADINNKIPATPNFSFDEVASGTYNLKVKFYNGQTTYIWSDTLIVLSKQSTEKEIIIPNVVGQKPAAPTDFTAMYRNPDLIDSEYYDVQFLWTDNSNNEEYFTIELMDVTDSADSANIAKVMAGGADAGTAWNSLLTTLGSNVVTTLVKDIYSKGDIYVSGSLDANQQFLVVNLSLGKRYIARLASHNSAGNSETWNYLDVSNAAGLPAVAYTKNGSATELQPVVFDNTVTTINRFSITYDLVGGKYKDTTYTAADEIQSINDVLTASQTHIKELDGTASRQIIYYSQKEGGNEILNPLKVSNVDTTTKTAQPYFSLVKGGYSWTAWKLNSVSGATVYNLDHTNPLPTQLLRATGNVNSEYNNAFTGCKNIKLFAVYGAAAVNIYNPADVDFHDEDIYVFKRKDTGEGLTGAIEVTTLDEAVSFKINNDIRSGAAGTNGYRYVIIAARKNTYEKISLDVYSETLGIITTLTEPSATTMKAKRYALTTSEPDDWSTNKGAYYTKDKRVFTSASGAGDWSAKNYYALVNDGSADDNFVYFVLDVGSTFGNGAYLLKVKGYKAVNPKTPFTYNIGMNVQADSTYSQSLYQPLGGTTVAATEFFSDSTGTTGVTTWAPTGVYQRD